MIFSVCHQNCFIDMVYFVFQCRHSLFHFMRLFIVSLYETILLCRVFFPHDLDSAADAILAGGDDSNK